MGLVRNRTPHPSARFLILYALMTERGLGWLTGSELALAGGCSNATAYRIVGELERLGILPIERRDQAEGGGFRARDVYRSSSRASGETVQAPAGISPPRSARVKPGDLAKSEKRP